MSRADAAARLLAAAETLGARDGVGALSIQAIATAAGVSKALVLYHFEDKTALLHALHAQLNADGTARLRAAAAAGDPLDAWRAMVLDGPLGERLALAAALAREAALAGEQLVARAREREAAATELARAILRAVELTPRTSVALIARVLIRHLDGLAIGRTAVPRPSDDLADEVDTFALGLLALGR